MGDPAGRGRRININGRYVLAWTTTQAAAHCGIKPATYRDYIRKSGAPRALPFRGANGELLFDVYSVRTWHRNRPGRGRHRPA